MNNRIEIDKKNGLIICRDNGDGRVYRAYVNKRNKFIYICEDCEAIWESLEDLAHNFLSQWGSINSYLKYLDPVFNSPNSREDVARHLVYGDYVHIDELRPFLPDSTEIVEI